MAGEMWLDEKTETQLIKDITRKTDLLLQLHDDMTKKEEVVEV